MLGLWLKNILDRMSLNEEDFEYLLGRGGKEETIKEFGIKTWDCKLVKESDIGDSNFTKINDKLGRRIDGTIVIPFYSPSGDVIGLESRKRNEKVVVDYRTLASKWNPVTIGMNKYFNDIMNGGSVWVVEGVYDLFAMEWVIPKGDAVLAMVRANISKNHAKFFSRTFSNVNLVFDNDKAGKEGTDIAVLTMRKYVAKCKVVKYSWKDPGDIWDGGGESLLKDVFLRYCGKGAI